MKKFLNFVLIIFLLLVIVNNQEAHAYINPGSGSYSFQTIIGGLLAVGTVFKKLLGSITGLFKKHKDTDGEQDE